jgi:uncharacterized protein YukE
MDIESCRPEVKSLAESIVALIKADALLTDAKNNVPRYTGDCPREEYFADEQQKWNNAANKLNSEIRKLIRDTVI